MKNATDWRLEYQKQLRDDSKPRTLVFSDDSFVKAIQLDAMKEGMIRAETVAQQLPNPFLATEQRKENYAAKWMRDAISVQLKAAAEQLTTEQL